MIQYDDTIGPHSTNRGVFVLTTMMIQYVTQSRSHIVISQQG